jgi:hypothetical protein
MNGALLEGNGRNIALWIAQVLLCVMFLMKIAGRVAFLTILSHYPATPAKVEHIRAYLFLH